MRQQHPREPRIWSLGGFLKGADVILDRWDWVFSAHSLDPQGLTPPLIRLSPNPTHQRRLRVQFVENGSLYRYGGHAWNPRTWKEEVEETGVQGQRGLHELLSQAKEKGW